MIWLATKTPAEAERRRTAMWGIVRGDTGNAAGRTKKRSIRCLLGDCWSVEIAKKMPLNHLKTDIKLSPTTMSGISATAVARA